MTPTTDTLSPSLPEAAAQTAAPAARISELQRLYWSIRRELWENRSIYIAPLAVAALILLGFTYSAFAVPKDVFLTTTSNVNGVITRHSMAPVQIYVIAAGLIMATTMLVGIFYCLDALYGERRDRSILFWKSLPISDTTTVLSKAAVPFLVLPLLTWGITVVTQSIMLVVNLSVFHARGMDTSALHNIPLTQNAVMLLYHLFAIHVLWYAPIWAWFLMVSAWARRAPLIWAILPPFALGVLELITLHTAHIFDLLKYRIHGPDGSDAYTASMSTQMSVSPAHFLTTPGLWIGLLVAALFLAAAIQLRHYRNPI